MESVLYMELRWVFKEGAQGDDEKPSVGSTRPTMVSAASDPLAAEAKDMTGKLQGRNGSEETQTAHECKNVPYAKLPSGHENTA